MDATSGLLTISEAAKLLRMLPSRVKRLAKAGLVPHVALPDGELRFDERDLNAWIDAHKRGNGIEPSDQ